jgi:hypothetical protein
MAWDPAAAGNDPEELALRAEIAFGARLVLYPRLGHNDVALASLLANLTDSRFPPVGDLPLRITSAVTEPTKPSLETTTDEPRDSAHLYVTTEIPVPEVREAKTSAGRSAFVSYAHRDERYRRQMDIALAQLSRNMLISVWHDKMILPGQEWEQEIDENLERADIVLLLVSPDFLASDYAYGSEMLRALKRQRAGEAIVVPIIVRPSEWQYSPLGSLQALPSQGRPVSTWPNRDQAWLNIAQGLRRLISQ